MVLYNTVAAAYKLTLISNQAFNSYLNSEHLSRELPTFALKQFAQRVCPYLWLVRVVEFSNGGYKIRKIFA